MELGRFFETQLKSNIKTIELIDLFYSKKDIETIALATVKLLFI